MSALPSGESLIVAAVSGDRAALERLLLDAYAPLANHVTRQMPQPLQSRFSIEDVLQDVFVQAFRHILTYQPGTEAAFLAWLRTIATNRLVDLSKSEGRQKRGGGLRQIHEQRNLQSSTVADLVAQLAMSSTTPSRVAVRQEAVSAMHVALAALPDTQRQAIRLRYLEGRGVDEIAAALGCSTAAVRGHLDRGKRNLRAAMGRASVDVQP